MKTNNGMKMFEDIVLYLNANEPNGLYIKNVATVNSELKRLENQDDVIENCIHSLECGMTTDALTMLYALRDRSRKENK